MDVPATEIVPGDVILLAAGDLVPADCRLIETRDLYANEALLTGEPYPVEKEALSPIPDQHDAALPCNVVFMGSSIVSGTAKALVVATGRKAQLVHREQPTRVHVWARPLWPPETSRTNTSSRLGGIG